MTDKTLWGQPDDEYLHYDPSEVLDYIVDAGWWQDDDTTFPHSFDVGVCEFSTRPPGGHPFSNFPDADDIIVHLIERFCEEWHEEMYEEYMDHASDDDVVAAFQAARDLLVSKQKFLVADEVIRTVTFRVTIKSEDGDWDYEEVRPGTAGGE